MTNTIIIDATITQDRPRCGMGNLFDAVIPRIIKKKTDWNFKVLLFSNVKSTMDLLIEEELSNIEVIRIGPMLPSMINPLAFVFQRLPAALYLKVKYPQAIWFSIFHVYGFFPRIFKTVLAQHDMALANIGVYANKGAFVNFGRKLEYWFHLNRSRLVSKIWSITEYSRNEHLGYFPENKDKVRMITLASDKAERPGNLHEQYLPQDWKEKGYLIYLGAGTQRSKNSHGVVRGYANFLKKLETKKGISTDAAPYLIIAGGNFANQGEATAFLNNVVSEEKVTEKVVFSGFYEQEDRWDLLRNAFGFIHLSLAEGFGIAQLEALTVGTPAILHKGTSLPEVAGDSAIWVDGEDVDDVGSKIYELFTNKEMQEKHKQLGIERSKLFSWEKTVDGVIGIFTEMFEE
jgi:glycosyltransferase involved in cell wall biosynthesis